jgi:hypothetical protein
MQHIPSKQITPLMKSFAKGIGLKPKINPATYDQPFARWTVAPSVKFRTGRLDRLYTFGIKSTRYQFETAAMWYPGNIKPRWGCFVRHADWKMHLATLETLLPGRGAELGDTIQTFLPDDGSGGAVSEGQGRSLLELHAMDEDKLPAATRGTELLVQKLMDLSMVISGY